MLEELELKVGTTEYEGLKITIGYDECPEDPRGWNTFGTMICFHRRYQLGDKHDYKSSDYNSWNELKNAIIKKENAAIILPLYMYDHSGITISTKPFSCPWDSGQIGYIYISKEKVRNEYNVKKITKSLLDKVTEYLISEVKTYDQYLTGEVYYFSIEDEDNNTLDSCYGYIGDLNYVISECKSSVEYYIEERRKMKPTREREALERKGQLCFNFN